MWIYIYILLLWNDDKCAPRCASRVMPGANPTRRSLTQLVSSTVCREVSRMYYIGGARRQKERERERERERE